MTNAIAEAPATEKQLDYIASLISQHTNEYRRTVRELGPMTAADATGDRRHDYRRYQACALLVTLWSAVKLPTLTQANASKVIDRLKQSSMTVLDGWLDSEKAAKTYGVLDFINANRDAVEKASRNAY